MEVIMKSLRWIGVWLAVDDGPAPTLFWAFEEGGGIIRYFCRYEVLTELLTFMS